MPAIKRWYPVSHNLNDDPEFIKLRLQFGDWMGFVWHELLSWGDRNDGECKGDTDTIALRLSRVSLQMYQQRAANKVKIALQYMQDVGWIRIERDRIVILNHLKYHRPREQKENPQGDGIGSPPSEPSEPSEPEHIILHHTNEKEVSSPPSGEGVKETHPAPSSQPIGSYSESFESFWRIYPKIRGTKYEAWKAWEQLRKSKQLPEEGGMILCVKKELGVNRDWQTENGKFIPAASSWLRSRRFLDLLIEIKRDDMCQCGCGFERMSNEWYTIHEGNKSNGIEQNNEWLTARALPHSDKTGKDWE